MNTNPQSSPAGRKTGSRGARDIRKPQPLKQSAFANYRAAAEKTWTAATPQPIALAQIDPRPTALRVALDPEVVADLAATMKSGIQLPPVKLRRVGPRFTVVDGEYRIAAARESGYDSITAVVDDCDDVIAAILALRENSTHGTKLSKLELRGAVRAQLTGVPGLMAAVVAQDVSLRAAADMLVVSHWLVASVRDEILASTKPAEKSSGAAAKSTGATRAAPVEASKAGRGEPSSTDTGKDQTYAETPSKSEEVVLIAKDLIRLVQIFAAKLQIDPAGAYAAACTIAGSTGDVTPKHPSPTE